MRLPRFLGAVARRAPLGADVRARFHEASVAEGGLRTVLDTPRCLVAADAAPVALGESGVLLGSWLRRGSAGAVTCLDGMDQRAIRASRGAHLAATGWGSWVAILIDAAGERTDLVRAPWGSLPCFHHSVGDVLWCASEVALLGRIEALRIDRDELARFLLAEDIIAPRTCLAGVDELRMGERLAVSPHESEAAALWSPWNFCAPDSRINDPAEAAARLREAVQQAVGALTADHERIVLRLSGGIDSSIVACALAAAGRNVTALTLSGADMAGDERHYARAVTDQLGATLFARCRDVRDVDVITVSRPPGARPLARSFGQATAAASARIAQATGATATLGGGGGDQVFCGLPTARLAADCLLDAGGRRALGPTLTGLARIAQASVGQVAWQAWRASRRAPGYGLPLDGRFLTPAATTGANHRWRHPWLAAPAGALPGRAAHVACLVAAEPLVTGDASSGLPDLSPLLSQPVVETALRVPSWQWVGPGLDRFAARQAFADLLPPAIYRRRSKGSPDGFVIAVLEANRAPLRAMLVEGDLAGMGLIDRAAIAAAFDDPRPVTGVDFYRLMRLADAEAWARTYQS